VYLDWRTEVRHSTRLGSSSVSRRATGARPSTCVSVTRRWHRGGRRDQRGSDGPANHHRRPGLGV